MSLIQTPWIETGYRIFAYQGPGGLKVERLSKEVGKNKSSFYHLFADMEVFITLLLEHHLSRFKTMAQKEATSSNLEELINTILEYKIDLLFNRQLRIHRENQQFQNCFLESNRISLPSIVPMWSEMIGLKENSDLAELVLQLSLENFFLQITDETLHPTWLYEYFMSIQNLVGKFKNTSFVRSLNGGV